MSGAKSQDAVDDIGDIIRVFLRKGVHLWAENGQLRYRAPKGALAPNDLNELRSHRERIIIFLERSIGAATLKDETDLQLQPRYAPLAFSQLAHWNLHQLGARRSSSIIPAILRVRGPLNVAALCSSVEELVRRHGALRTKIEIFEGEPLQRIDRPGECQMVVTDLSGISEPARDVEVNCSIERQVFGAIDVAADPLFRVQLLIIGQMEFVLIISMHHIISDGFSVKIVLRELFRAYEQALGGAGVSLSEIPFQFADHAVWQRNMQKSLVGKNAAYLQDHLGGCKRLRFPSDKLPMKDADLGTRVVSFEFERKLRTQLNEWSRLRGTTVVMSVFSAYVAFVLRWCKASEGVFLYETDGRFNQEMQEAVGYFAFPLFLRIGLSHADRFSDLLRRVTQEYCRAYEHAEFFYSATQVPVPDFVYGPSFNWVGRDLNWAEEDAKADCLHLGKSSIEISWVPLEYKILDSVAVEFQPSVSVFENDSSIRGYIAFPENRFSAELMERFAFAFPMFVEGLIQEASQSVASLPLSWGSGISSVAFR